MPARFKRCKSDTNMLFRPKNYIINSSLDSNETTNGFNNTPLNGKCDNGKITVVGPPLVALLKKLGYTEEEATTNHEKDGIEKLRLLLPIWIADGKNSYIAFEGMIYLLEICLHQATTRPLLFQTFLEITGELEFVKFIKQAVPLMIDSDMLHASNYIDTLLTSLALYLANTGSNVLAQVIDAVPYFSGHYLCVHTKRFEELFCFIHSHEKRQYDPETQRMSITVKPHYLSCMHFPQRKIIVSNAPPVKLRKRSVLCREKFACDVSAGGLVSGLKPSLESTDVWVSYLDTALVGLDKIPPEMVPRLLRENVQIPSRFRRASSLSRSRSLSSDDETLNKLQDFLWDKAQNDFLSLQRRLDWFAEHNFAVNPLVILKDDHKPFYNGISNGLFWPAFHDLPEYIIDDYKGENRNKLEEDWIRYSKVNFYFAIHTARTCRTQDFLWIHDYHLFLVGLILRSLDPTLNAAFFLHIPFRLSDKFMQEYAVQGKAVLRGLLGFKRVGFQTNSDCCRFVELVHQHIPEAQLIEKRRTAENLIYTIRYGEWISDIGTFPISVKPSGLMRLAKSEITTRQAAKYREQIMQTFQADGKLFISIERFDYTKGILERLSAIKRYFEKYPDRVGRDVFYQVAASSRGDISAYNTYHNKAHELAEEINEQFGHMRTESEIGTVGWQPVVVDTVNHPQDEVVQLYKASDVVVVTPIADGMNLVIKEAILCNPNAAYVLSSGAGAEQQLFDAGLQDCYFRVSDIKDTESFADLLHRAATTPVETLAEWGQRLHEYTASHDVEHWMSSFCDPQWTSSVMPLMPLTTDAEIERMIRRLQEVRQNGVSCLLRSIHIGEELHLSFTNALQSLENNDDITLDPRMRGFLRGIKLDLQLTDAYSTHKSTDDIVDTLTLTATRQFQAETARLLTFLEDLGHVDVWVCNFAVLVSNGGYRRESAYFGEVPLTFQVQSMASGMLYSRYAARYVTNTVIVNQLPLSHLDYAMTIPKDWTILGAERGKKWIVHGESLPRNDEVKTFKDGLAYLSSKVALTRKDDRALICCKTAEDIACVEWALNNYANVYVILMTCDRDAQQRLVQLVPLSHICEMSHPDVLCSAMAQQIVKTVDIC